MQIGIIIAGIITIIFGVIFHLQGIGVVGPEASFMYSEPEWAGYGMYIAIAGAAVTAYGSVRLIRHHMIRSS